MGRMGVCMGPAAAQDMCHSGGWHLAAGLRGVGQHAALGVCNLVGARCTLFCSVF